MEQMHSQAPALWVLERDWFVCLLEIRAHLRTGRHIPPSTEGYGLFAGLSDGQSRAFWRTRTTLNVDVSPPPRKPLVRGLLRTSDLNCPHAFQFAAIRICWNVNKPPLLHCQRKAAATIARPLLTATGLVQSQTHQPPLCLHTGLGPSSAGPSGIGGRVPSIPAEPQAGPATRPVQLSTTSCCCIAHLCLGMPAGRGATGPCSMRDRRQSAVIKHGNLLPIYC